MSTATNTDLLRAPSPARNALGGLTVVLACLDEAENLPDAVRHATQAAERHVGCAFRLASRELLQSLDLRASGPLVGAELLVKSRIAGARAAEAPVHHKARVAGRHSGSGRRLSARTLRELADLRRALRN